MKIQLCNNESILIRHPDDVKPWFDETEAVPLVHHDTPEWPEQQTEDSSFQPMFDDFPVQMEDENEAQSNRRSSRNRKPNSLYTDFVKY